MPFGPRNHFALVSEESTTEFITDAFSWIGFPQKKAIQTIHKSKASPSKVLNHLSLASDGRLQWNNAKFLIISATLESKSEYRITGKFDNTNIKYVYEGFKPQGYSLRGMSGGALFHDPKKFNANPNNLSDFFLFAGIGLEYDGALIKGVPKELIVCLIDEMLNSAGWADGFIVCPRGFRHNR